MTANATQVGGEEMEITFNPELGRVVMDMGSTTAASCLWVLLKDLLVLREKLRARIAELEKAAAPTCPTCGSLDDGGCGCELAAAADEAHRLTPGVVEEAKSGPAPGVPVERVREVLAAMMALNAKSAEHGRYEGFTEAARSLHAGRARAFGECAALLCKLLPEGDAKP